MAGPIGLLLGAIIGIVAAFIGVDAAKKLIEDQWLPGFITGLLLSEPKINEFRREFKQSMENVINEELAKNIALQKAKKDLGRIVDKSIDDLGVLNLL